jgi:hypothetical protein
MRAGKREKMSGKTMKRVNRKMTLKRFLIKMGRKMMMKRSPNKRSQMKTVPQRKKPARNQSQWMRSIVTC